MRDMKLFWNASCCNDISYVRMNDFEQYYSILNSYRRRGYKQVIVSVELMIDILSDRSISDEFVVRRVDLADNVLGMKFEINELVDGIHAGDFTISNLVIKLKELSEHTSIGIKSITMQLNERDYGDKESSIVISSNGIISAGDNVSDRFVNTIVNIIKNKLI